MGSLIVTDHGVSVVLLKGETEAPGRHPTWATISRVDAVDRTAVGGGERPELQSLAGWTAYDWLE